MMNMLTWRVVQTREEILQTPEGAQLVAARNAAWREHCAACEAYSAIKGVWLYKNDNSPERLLMDATYRNWQTYVYAIYTIQMHAEDAERAFASTHPQEWVRKHHMNWWRSAVVPNVSQRFD